MIGADEALGDEASGPLAWPVALAGAKGYRANWIDQYLLELEINPVIPAKENEDRDARPVEFDREAYRDRNMVERLIGWLKECRRLVARYEKTAKNFEGMIRMAFIQHYLRSVALSTFRTEPRPKPLVYLCDAGEAGDSAMQGAGPYPLAEFYRSSHSDSLIQRRKEPSKHADSHRSAK